MTAFSRAAFGTRKLTAFSIPSPASNSNCVCSRDLGAKGPKRHQISPSVYLCVTVDPERPCSAGCAEPARELFSAALSRHP